MMCFIRKQSGFGHRLGIQPSILFDIDIDMVIRYTLYWSLNYLEKYQNKILWIIWISARMASNRIQISDFRSMDNKTNPNHKNE